MSTATFQTLPLLFTAPEFHVLSPSQQFQLLYLAEAYTEDKKQAQADLVESVRDLKQLQAKDTQATVIGYMELRVKVLESMLVDTAAQIA